MDGWALWHFKHPNNGYIMPETEFISKANGVYKRKYSFRMNIMEEIFEFEFRSCTEILANDIKIYTTDQYTG